MTLTGLSGSRGSAISWGITLLAFFLWKSTRKWGVYAFIIAGTALLVAPFVFMTTIERFLGAPGDTVLGGREYIWPAAWQLIQDHILTGVGIGNSSFQVIPYMINSGAMFVSPTSEPLHNPVLVIWAETGFPGLLLYLWVLISAAGSFYVEYLYTRKLGLAYLSSYFELVAAMFLGFMTSWIKGGGMESSFSYFLVLSLLYNPHNIEEVFFPAIPSIKTMTNPLKFLFVIDNLSTGGAQRQMITLAAGSNPAWLSGRNFLLCTGGLFGQTLDRSQASRYTGHLKRGRYSAGCYFHFTKIN